MTAPPPHTTHASVLSLLGLLPLRPAPLPHAALITLAAPHARAAQVVETCAAWTGGGVLAVVDTPLHQLVGWPRMTTYRHALDLVSDPSAAHALAVAAAHGHCAVISTATLMAARPSFDLSALLTYLAQHLASSGPSTGGHAAVLIDTACPLNLNDVLRAAMLSPSLHLMVWTPPPDFCPPLLGQSGSPSGPLASWRTVAAYCDLAVIEVAALSSVDLHALLPRLPRQVSPTQPAPLAVGLGHAPAADWMNRRWCWATPTDLRLRF